MTAGPAPRVAYLTGQYPEVSHTFIQREIVALRALGLDVVPCAVRRSSADKVVGADQHEEAARTFCILDRARNPLRLLGAHLEMAVHAPRRWLGALALAWRTSPPGLGARLWQAFYFAEAGVLAAYLRRARVSHLHNHFADSSCTVSMLACHMADIPFSFTEHGPTVFFDVGRWRLDEKIARARFVVAISHFCRSQLMLFSDPRHWSKMEIVHCGVLPERYGRDPARVFGKRILFVGRMDPVKGVLVLLDAFARISARHPDARLDLVGDGAYRADCQAAARALGLQDRVAFLGYRDQDEVAAILAQSDMLVLPSFAEGVPVVLMEAMATRIPVIASRVAGVAELVEDGVSGRLVAPGDAEDLARQMDLLLCDPQTCHDMGLAGRRKVEAEFDIRHEAAKLHGLFHRG